MSTPKSANIFWHHGKLTNEDRIKHLGQKGAVIWFTGLSASGKSTVAREVELALVENKKSSYVLDGDNIRHGLNRDLDFSDAGRVENVRRIGEVGGSALFGIELAELTAVKQLKNKHHGGEHRGHSAKGHDSEHHATETKFATEIGEEVTRAVQSHAVRDIVLVAPKRFLGDLLDREPHEIAQLDDSALASVQFGEAG